VAVACCSEIVIVLTNLAPAQFVGKGAARVRAVMRVPQGLVLWMGTLLRYPSQVGDVSERPKVQHSKCCLV
jgi:hypothetical protein